MKKILITALAIPLLMCAGCQDDKEGTPKSYPTQIPATDRFPVVAWHGVRSTFASVERFQEAEDMGITLNYSRMSTVDNALRMLDLAAKTNVKLIVECDELYKSEERRDAVRRLMGHSALAGYFMADEPHTNAFADLAVRISDVRQVDSKHLCYSNILPTGSPEHYKQLGVANYREYVQRYLNECKPSFLSFDLYPVVADDKGLWTKAEWYEALEVTRDEAKLRNMEMWAFLLTVPHSSYPVPTTDQLRLQAYSNLAYGAQALQCFTYWTPTVADPEIWKYRNAPIEEDGTRSATYDLVKNVLQEVQNVAWIFRGCQVEGVWHLTPGARVPEQTTPLRTLPEKAEEISLLQNEKGLVSVLTNHGYTFLVFQNTSVSETAHATLKMKPGVRFVGRDGSITLASEQDAAQTLTPGDVRIYMW